jgi:hypothetical protein
MLMLVGKAEECYREKILAYRPGGLLYSNFTANDEKSVNWTCTV